MGADYKLSARDAADILLGRLVLTSESERRAANREAELMRIIEEKDAQICKLRHAINKLEQKYGMLKKKKGGERNALGNG